MADFFDNWTKQVRKGILEFCILKALQRQDLYGYALVKKIASMRGLEVAEGTIYPLLSRLKAQALVETRLEESPEGPARKYYSLTKAGRVTLNSMEVYFSKMCEGINDLTESEE